MQIDLGDGLGVHSLGPDDWRGEGRMKAPRAPKPALVVSPRGYVQPELERRVFAMAKAGKTIPEISAATRLVVGKVRHMLVSRGVDFMRAKRGGE